MTDLIASLAAVDEPDARRAMLQNAAVPAAGVAPGIQSAVVSCLYADPARAARLVAAGREWAGLSGEALAAAYAGRGEAHLAFVQGRHGEAARLYEEAAAAFASQAATGEEARTLSSGLQALIYLGRYDEARQWAERAEAIFLQDHDALRLARLDSNVGNIHFRQDQPHLAIARYERALEAFTELGDDKDIAAALSNLVVAHTSLGQFREAMAYHHRVSEHCRRRNLAPLSAQADYNIAYLHFLRGDYAEAREAFRRSREICAQNGDSYHAALCDLDESELLLELNLPAEGEWLARRAGAGFEALGMRYEQAKAAVNVAVAASQQGDLRRAARLLKRSRVLFAAEGNQVWPAMIDLLRANLAFLAERFGEAKRLSVSAWEVLSQTMIPSRAAHCQLLLARLWLREGQPDRARAVGREAVKRLGAHPSPSLLFHANLLEGEVNEMQGRWPQALAAYETARGVLEDLRGRLESEDLRISLLKDKLAVYESLVSMFLDSPLAASEDGQARALLMVQQAKSRSLADRLLQPSGPAAQSADEPGAAQLDSLLSDLNWHYRQIELAVLLQRSGLASGPLAELRRRARELEQELLEERSKHRPAADSPPFLGTAETLSGLQEAIPAGCLVLEYFEARGILLVFVLSATGLDVVRLGPSAPVRQALKLLQYQLGKAGRIPRQSRTAKAGDPAVKGLAETHYHLAELYARLIRPVERWLEGGTHLVFAPHGQLHGLPFAALHDGTRSLMDRFTISVAPSASVYAACRRPRPGPALGGAVVMAVPDPQNRHIEAEARAVAELIPGARLCLGDGATREAFLREAAGVSTLHLAAHGVFRRDNPLFSSIQLADGRLNPLDLASTRLDVGLLTLSACSSGVSVPVGGDELRGLMRGFLASGVRRLVVSLWEVDDVATSEFMRAFYGQLGSGIPVEEAMRSAMQLLRGLYPHPYHWAPFMLVGNAP